MPFLSVYTPFPSVHEHKVKLCYRLSTKGKDPFKPNLHLVCIFSFTEYLMNIV